MWLTHDNREVPNVTQMYNTHTHRTHTLSKPRKKKMVEINESLLNQYDTVDLFLKGLQSWKKCTLPAVVPLFKQVVPDINSVKKHLANIKVLIQVNKKNDYWFVDVDLENNIQWILNDIRGLMDKLKPLNIKMDTIQKQESQKNKT